MEHGSPTIGALISKHGIVFSELFVFRRKGMK